MNKLPIKIGVIDDISEKNNAYENLYGQYRDIVLFKFFNSLCECSDYIKNDSLDALFVNVDCPNFCKKKIEKLFDSIPDIVFTGDKAEQAIIGYELNALDFIMKPMCKENLIRSIKKIISKQNYQNEHIDDQNQYFFVKTEFRLQKIDVNKILYIEGMGDYLKIVTPQEKIFTLQNFKNLETKLPSLKFCRVHKSYIVSLNKINYVEKNQIKIGEADIPISETYKKRFYQILDNFKLC